MSDGSKACGTVHEVIPNSWATLAIDSKNAGTSSHAARSG